MGYANHHRGHKTTLICPTKGCGYTSRKFVSMFEENKISVSSSKCPIHQVSLKDIGGSKKSVSIVKSKHKKNNNGKNI